MLASGNLPMEYTVKLTASSQTVFRLAEDKWVVIAPKAAPNSGESVFPYRQTEQSNGFAQDLVANFPQGGP